jgi:hypothetical protein
MNLNENAAGRQQIYALGHMRAAEGHSALLSRRKIIIYKQLGFLCVLDLLGNSITRRHASE